MHRKRYNLITACLILLTFSGCAFVSIDLLSLMKTPRMQERVLYKGSPDKVLVVEVLGLITNTRVRQMLTAQEGTLERVDGVLRTAAKDQSIKAIILRIDSPGGSVTASDLLYRRIIEYKNTKKIPVVACITNLGASGAYMIALSSDRIVALPTSMIGNIGVLMPLVSYQGLMDMIGIRDQTITSGKYKDAGSPMRDMTDEERSVYKAIVDEMFADFMLKVKSNRPQMTEEDLKIAGDGRLMTAKFALDHHLIDEVGYYENVIKSVEKITDIKNPTVVVYRRDTENQGGFYSWP